MAIYNAVPPPESPSNTEAANSHASQSHHHAPSVASTASLDIESWTVSALQALSVSPLAQGTGGSLTIPLDGSGPGPAPEPASVPKPATFRVSFDPGLANIAPPRRSRSRRDSMRTRDALLKGEFSHRRRQRYDNDRLAHIPGAQQPLEPVDLVAGPTYVVHDHVPYHIAKEWDRGLREHVEDERARLITRRKAQQQWATAGLWVVAAKSAKAGGGKVPKPQVGHVTRDLRAWAKRTPVLTEWIRELEEPIRQFLVEEDARIDAEAEAQRAAAESQQKKAAADLSAGESGLDSEDEEIVFVGRQNAAPRAPKVSDGGAGWKKAHREVPDGRALDSGIVLDSFGDDESSSFRRWLTHSISEYYGLISHTATTGTPIRKIVYVGIEPAGKKKTPHGPAELPLPLWTRF
ncbi:hypothetical protein RB595_006031 [Gaeumannomyces hyphopodioides]